MAESVTGVPTRAPASHAPWLVLVLIELIGAQFNRETQEISQTLTGS